MPIRRISSATGMPISTCFTAAVICSTEYRFRFIGKTPLSVIVPELTSALCQFFGGRSNLLRTAHGVIEDQRRTIHFMNQRVLELDDVCNCLRYDLAV